MPLNFNQIYEIEKEGTENPKSATHRIRENQYSKTLSNLKSQGNNSNSKSY
jgi:hypothetical protein